MKRIPGTQLKQDPVATTAEMQAGAETKPRRVSPVLVWESIASWWSTVGRLAPGDIGGTTPAAGTFTTLNGGIKREEVPTTGNLTVQQMRGTLISNSGQTVANTQQCPTLTGEMNGLVQVETAGAGAFYIKTGPNDRPGISSGGVITWGNNGDKVGFATPSVGDSFTFKTIKVGVDAFDLIIYPGEGNVVNGGA